eukprot:5031535-Ditylum_brightwellii.AAC.1
MAEQIIWIWDPERNNIMRGGKEKNACLYHSNPLVLPDGALTSTDGGTPGLVKNCNGQLLGLELDVDEVPKEMCILGVT